MNLQSKPHKGWLKPFLKPLRPLFTEVLFKSLFVGILGLAAPLFVLQVYDRVVFQAGLSTLQGLVIGMGVAILFDFMLRQARSRVVQRMALQIDTAVAPALFDRLQHLPLRVLESRPASFWQSLFRDVEVVRNTLSGATAILVADLPFVFIFIGLVYIIATPVAWVFVAIVPVFLLLAWRSAASIGAATFTERQASLARDALLGEMMAGRTTIKALALAPAMTPGWEQRHVATIREARSRGAVTDTYTNIGTSLTMLTTIVLTSVGALAILEQEMTIGSLVAANILAGRFVAPLNQLVSTWRNFAGFKQASQRLGEVFALTEERRESALSLHDPQGLVTLEKLRFHFGDENNPIIDNLNLAIGPNGLHGVTGRNGSGKTTLLKLMQGLYAPVEGRVLLDDQDVAQFTRRELARWIGYVPQECFLFAGTIRDNIAIGDPDAEDDVILRAAKRAGVHEFVVGLPDGYATDIGEAGTRLSGGQRQRIAIARALLGEPKVLLLDEPSGNLDRAAEDALKTNLVDLSRDHTVIAVTHSPALLAACHTTLVLEGGRIVLAGKPEDVLPRLFGTAPAKQPAKVKTVP